MVPSIRVQLMQYGKAHSWLDSCFHTCDEERERESFECIWTINLDAANNSDFFQTKGKTK